MLLFFDLGLSTGWAHDNADGDGKPKTGLITLPGGVDGRHGHAFDLFHKRLVILIPQVDPRLIGYEAPIASLMIGGTHLDATLVLITLAGIVEMVAHQLGIPYRRLSVSTIRKEFCGNGHAKKKTVGLKCRDLGWDVGLDDNRADAAAGWCALHRLHARALADAQSRMLP